MILFEIVINQIIIVDIVLLLLNLKSSVNPAKSKI